MSEGERTSPLGVVGDSIKRLVESFTGFLSSKLELISVELQEEKRRILELLILAAAALLFGVLALTVLTFSVVALFWDGPYRFVALFVVSAIYLAGSGILFVRLQRKVHSAVSVFEATVEELKKDTEWVNRHL